MRIRVIVRTGTPPQTETYLFGDVFVQQKPKFFPLLASLTAHGLLLALIPTLLQTLYGFGYAPAAQPVYHVEMLHLQLPDRVFLPAARPHPEQSHPEQSQAEKPAPPRDSSQARPAAGAGQRSRVSTPKGLELPVTRHVSDEAPVILQPDSAAIPAPSVPAVPPLAFWAKAIEPPPPTPRRRQTVIPGRVQQAVSPNLDAPPVLSPSNPQPVTSDIAAVLAPSQTAPKLPLPNSSTNPIRMPGKGAADLASFEVSQSDPLRLIYLMAETGKPKQVEIPKGLQNTPRARAGGGTEMANGRAPGPVEQSGHSAAELHDREIPGRGGAATVPGAASGASKAPGRTASAAGETVPARAAASSAPTGAGQQAVLEAANSPQSKSAAGANPVNRPAAARPPDPVQNNSAAVIRIAHPANGNFDVVILQSVSRDDLPDAGASLSGNPVYTVYLKVGDEREWLLEYCIPASGNTRASTYQVNIDDPGVVSAPYPVATVIPRNVLELQHSKHIALHGLLSTTGVFHNVTAPDMEDPLVREVLPLLNQWQFRPALRDKVPVEVEILLIIPARS